MNDTQALFSRLTALAAYFEGGSVRTRAEEVFSPRAILRSGRDAGHTERIRAAEAFEEAGSSARDTVRSLLQQLSGGTAHALSASREQQTAFAPLTPNGGQEGGFSPLSRPGSSGAAPDADELSRAFRRDARRYDE